MTVHANSLDFSTAIWYNIRKSCRGLFTKSLQLISQKGLTTMPNGAKLGLDWTGLDWTGLDWTGLA